jgi:integrase
MEWKVQKDGKQSYFNANVFSNYYGQYGLMNDISTDNIRRYKSHMRIDLKYARGTINRKLASISKLITYCRGVKGFKFVWGAPLVEYEKENNQRKYIFTNDTLEKLYSTSSVCGYHHIVDLWKVLVENGCRLSEMLNLTWNDIEKGFMVVKDTKNGEDRVIPIFDNTQSIFDRLKSQGLSKPFPYKLDQVEYMWRRIRKAMGMQKEKDFVIHALRHTCITNLLNKQVRIEIVQRIVGHRDIRMTQRYNHPTRFDIRDALVGIYGKNEVVK